MTETIITFLQNPDPVILALVLAVLCAIFALLLILFNAVSGVLDLLRLPLEALAGVIGSGPEGWCGCLVVLALLSGAGFLLYTLANTCGSGSTMNFVAFGPFDHFSFT